MKLDDVLWWRKHRVLERQLVAEINKRISVEAELRRVEILLLAALELIEPEHVSKLGDLKLRREETNG